MGRATLASGYLTIPSGTTLSQSGTVNPGNTVTSLTVAGTLTHELASLNGMQLTVTGDAAVGAAGAIDVSLKGLRGGNTWGAGLAGETYLWNGTTYTVGAGASDWVGASHGGRGAPGYQPSAPAPYDSVVTPTMLGGGGGGNVGGHGGGRVDLVVGGTLTVDGKIIADGQGNLGNGNGGAGGTVRLRVGTLASSLVNGVPTTTGMISANAGANCGGSGGGRVAIEYAQSNYAGKLQASGTFGAVAGAGTIYQLNTTTQQTRLRAEQLTAAAGTSVATPYETLVPTTEGPFQTIDLLGARCTLTGPTNASASSVVNIAFGTVDLVGALTASQLAVSSSATVNVLGTLSSALSLSSGSVVVASTGTVNVPTFDSSLTGGTFTNRGQLNIGSHDLNIATGVSFVHGGTINGNNTLRNLTVAGTLTQDTHYLSGIALVVSGAASVSGSISLSGKGLYGGRQTGSTSASGEAYVCNTTQCTLTAGSTTNAGGSHGGVGATGSATAAAAYDFANAPVLRGGGGDASAATGGNAGGSGGGDLDLIVKGTLNVTGQIRADGNLGASSTNGGAGAGGAIRLRAHAITGSGVITANGGAPASGAGQASGGGGRIAIEYETGSGFGGTLQANGGTLNSKAGQIGTVVQRNLATQPSNLTPIVRGGAFAKCQLGATGSIACVGDDSKGMVSYAPVGVFTQLAVGAESACARHDSGLIECWGDTAGHALYKKPLTSLFSDVAVGVSAACAVRQGDSAVVCFGDNSDGLIGGQPAGQFTHIFMGERAACAQLADGTVSCFGNDATHAVSQAPTYALVNLDGGDGFFCGLSASGAIVCWGDNTLAQATPPAGFGYIDIATGLAHACALDASGAAVCWGDNSAGQSTPVAGSYDELAAGDAYTCARIVGTSSLSCWGQVPFVP